MPEALLVTACRSHGMPFGMLSTGANAQATESHAAISRHSTQHSCAQPIQSEAVDREAAASPMHRCNCACDISLTLFCSGSAQLRARDRPSTQRTFPDACTV